VGFAGALVVPSSLLLSLAGPGPQILD